MMGRRRFAHQPVHWDPLAKFKRGAAHVALGAILLGFLGVLVFSIITTDALR